MLVKQGNFSKKVSDLPDKPSPSYSPNDIKTYIETPPDEIKTTINNIIDALMQSNDGDSGADNIGATTITGLTGDKVQSLLESLKTYIDTHKNNKNNPHGVTASQLNVYTKAELAPYLQGGDTIIQEEVFTIVSSNNADGTFTYSDANGNQIVGNLTDGGGQIFTFQEGTYDLGLNRVECIVGDTLRRTVKSGGLAEIDQTHVALTIPEGNGREITFTYFERIGVSGEANLFVGNVEPPTSTNNTVWFKVVG